MIWDPIQKKKKIHNSWSLSQCPGKIDMGSIKVQGVDWEKLGVEDWIEEAEDVKGSWGDGGESLGTQGHEPRVLWWF